MTQPALGLLSSAIVMAIALGFVSLLTLGTLPDGLPSSCSASFRCRSLL